MMAERQEIVSKLRAGRAQDLTARELELIIGALEFADWAHAMYEMLGTEPPEFLVKAQAIAHG